MGSEKFTSQAFHFANVGLAVVDRSGRYVEVNERYCEIMGRSREEMLKLSLKDVNHPESHKNDELALRDMTAGKISSYTTEKRYIRADGVEVWSRLSARPIPNPEGQPEFFVGSIEDISSQKKYETDLVQANQQLLEAERIANMGSWSWTIGTNEVQWSHELYRIYGLDPSVKPSFELYLSMVHAEDKEAFLRDLQTSLQSKSSFESNHRIKLKDGSVRFLRKAATIRRDEKGNATRMVGLAYDTTEQITSQLKAREVDLKFQQVLDAIPDMVIVKGPGSRLHWANKAFREYYGMTLEEMRGALDAPHVPIDFSQQYMKDDAYVFNSGNVLEIPQEPIQSRNGEVRNFHTVKSPICDENGQIVLLVGVCRDITEKLAIEAAIEEQRARLVSASKMSALGEMAGGIAHEINNPLGIIQGITTCLLTEMERGASSQDSLQDGLQKIFSTSVRIAKVVKGLRLFSRNAERDPTVKADPRQVVQDTLELCAERFRFNDVELKVGEIDSSPIECRPAEIAQVLLNLLNNAYDAVVGQTGAWVRVEAERNRENLIFRVVDSGKGIEPSVAERMMNPFFTTKEVGKGTGLGLSISKGIMESHGGSLRYRSDQPNTTFEVELPLLNV